MRRIKSAPANLASMTNNKKEKVIFSTKKNNDIAIPLKNKYYPSYKLKKVKELKNKISFNGNLINDIVNDLNHLTVEESTFLFTFINIVTNNILKREKLQEIYNYLLQAIVRYLIMAFIHSQILHEKINIPLINKDCLNTICNHIIIK